MANNALPFLPDISAKDFNNLDLPFLRIRTEEDVVTWKSTRAYQNYLLFLHRLSDSVVGYALPQNDAERGELSPAVTSTLALLDEIDGWIDEIPPLNTPQRFGNLAFRVWGKKLEDNAESLVASLLPPHLRACTRLLIPYLIISFGSFTRMDYGTGHEAAFGLFLLCLHLVRLFEPVPAEERALVLVVFTRYLRLCWRLQDVYKLEPAGSHGVWGLDDYSFLGYIFGSGQLRDQRKIPVSAVLRPSLPPTNLYFLSISRIHEVKHGPFHEHSSQLHAIATGVPNWGKVHSGLFKMYEAEVLGKRVVVQHIPVGGLLEWGADEPSSPPASSSAALRSPPADAGTRAPWASIGPLSDTTLGHSQKGTSAPWARTPGNSTLLLPSRTPCATLTPAPSDLAASPPVSPPDS